MKETFAIPAVGAIIVKQAYILHLYAEKRRVHF